MTSEFSQHVFRFCNHNFSTQKHGKYSEHLIIQIEPVDGYKGWVIEVRAHNTVDEPYWLICVLFSCMEELTVVYREQGDPNTCARERKWVQELIVEDEMQALKEGERLESSDSCMERAVESGS